MTIIYYILILGVTIFIHELGHFLFAKKAGIYVYEFSIGMGPKLFGFKRKNDETSYSIRLIPLGGYVQMAGEEVEPDKSIPIEKSMQSKTWWQRFLTIVAGCTFNFAFAFILLLLIGVVYGSPNMKPYIGGIVKNSPASLTELSKGDLILKINGEKMLTIDDVSMKLALNSKGSTLNFEILKENNKTAKYIITPKKIIKDGVVSYSVGFSFQDKTDYGFISAFKFAIVKFGVIIKTMAKVIVSLVTGVIGISSLSGPVGIYNVVGESAKAGFDSIIYLVAFLSINVGFLNLLPIPAFDGGRILFLIIEKIKGSKVNPKIENIIHTIGFVLLMLLMIIVTIQDISRLI